MNLLGCVLFSHFEVTYHDAITCQCFNDVLPNVDTLSTAVVHLRYFGQSSDHKTQESSDDHHLPDLSFSEIPESRVRV